MNKSSALIISVAIIVGCVILGVLLRESPHDVKVQAQDLSMQDGRYQIISHGQQLLILDRRTGRCWRTFLDHSTLTTIPKPGDWTERSPDFAKTSKQK